MPAERSSLSTRGRVISVEIQPGATALTRTPSPPHAAASDFVNCATPPFDAE